MGPSLAAMKKFHRSVSNLNGNQYVAFLLLSSNFLAG
jgi:hypothetical protein